MDSKFDPQFKEKYQLALDINKTGIPTKSRHTKNNSDNSSNVNIIITNVVIIVIIILDDIATPPPTTMTRVRDWII